MIIGITGSFGAGKGAIVEYLVEEKGFRHFSARALLTEEIKKRGLPLDRDSMAWVANDLRRLGGPTAIFEKLVADAKEAGGDVVIESARAVAEARYIKDQGGYVLGVDADPEIRYRRTLERASETDQVSFEKWRMQELQEINPDDPAKQNIFGALRESDQIITNNGTLAELHQNVDNFLTTIHD